MPHLRPEDEERLTTFQKRSVTHLAVEEERPCLESTERIPRPVELSGHRHDVGVPVMPKRPHVRPSERFGPGLEVDAVAGRGHARALSAHPLEPVEIHDNAAILVVDVHVGRCDVGRRRLDETVVSQPGRQRAEPLFLLRWHLRRSGQEVRIGDLQTPGRMDFPGAQDIVGVREPDVPPLVVGKVEIVGAEPILDPFGHANQRRTLDVLPDARMQIGRDDRHVQQSLDAHAGGGRLGLEPALDREPDDPADKRDGPASSGHIHESGN